MASMTRKTKVTRQCACGEEYFGRADTCYACEVGQKADGTPWPPEDVEPPPDYMADGADKGL